MGEGQDHETANRLLKSISTVGDVMYGSINIERKLKKKKQRMKAYAEKNKNKTKEKESAINGKTKKKTKRN